MHQRSLVSMQSFISIITSGNGYGGLEPQNCYSYYYPFGERHHNKYGLKHIPRTTNSKGYSKGYRIAESLNKRAQGLEI